MRLGFSRHIFEKGLVYQISWKSVQWEPSYSTRTDGETWRSYRPLFATSRTRLKILTKFRSAALSGLRPPGSKHGWHWLSWARQRPLDRIWIPTCDKVRMLAKDKWNEYNSTTAELQILKWFTWTQRLSHHTREQIPSHCHHHHCRLQYNAQTVAASIKVPPPPVPRSRFMAVARRLHVPSISKSVPLHLSTWRAVFPHSLQSCRYISLQGKPLPFLLHDQPTAAWQF